MATKILEAKKILEQHAPAGEFLAYISREEAEILKSLGASGTPVKETGVPSFQLPGYLEDTAKDYAKQATATYGVPIDTSKFTGQQFVAGEDPLQTQAINLATQGVGAYAPYLSAAQQAATTAGADVAGARTGVAAGQADIAAAGADIAGARTAAGGLGALTGPTAYQPFMSPYQQDVIDTSLTEFDRQAQMRQQQMQDQTLGVPGAFGGGREGVQQAEYQSSSDRNRAMLQAGLLQQGFGQAQMGAQQAFANQQAIAQGQLGLGSAQQQFGQNRLGAAQAGLGLGQAQLGLGTAQMGLGSYQRAGLGADVGALGQLGSLRQAQTQAQLSAQQQAAQTAAYEPYGRLSQYGQGITGLTGGVAAAQYAQPQQADPMASALGTALGVGGLYQKIFHPQPMFGGSLGT
jgi:hypothetical protein